MKPSRRIIKNYDLFLALLKFSIKNDNKQEFQDLYLVNSYCQILKEIEDNLCKKFGEKFRDPSKDFAAQLRDVFREDLKECLPFIDNNEKKELIMRFHLIMYLHDVAIDRSLDDLEAGGLGWLRDIYTELKKIKTYFIPVLKIMKKGNKNYKELKKIITNN